MTAATTDVTALCQTVAEAPAVVPVGGRTHWGVGGPPGPGTEVKPPAGVLAYDPAELTVTVGAGTIVADLAAVLRDSGQECPLDPGDPGRATVGGTIAAGLSGVRRLRYGPLRDRVLEVRFVTGDGRVVKGGGPTVKNVSGYDLPRLLVGSLGTVGVLVQVTLRCQPLPRVATWVAGDTDPVEARRRCFRPSCVAWDGRTCRVLLEGHPEDVAAQADGAGLAPVATGPAWPEGPHRGRISVRPSRQRETVEALAGVEGVSWMAEVGVGTVHVAARTPAGLAAARRCAHAAGGWLLREAGGDGMDGFGAPVPNRELMRRIKRAFDPAGKLAATRLPL